MQGEGSFCVGNPDIRYASRVLDQPNGAAPRGARQLCGISADWGSEPIHL